MHVVCVDTKYLQGIDLAVLEQEVSNFTAYTTTASNQIVSRCIDAEIIITNKIVFDAAIINQLPKLKLICISATGTNNVDLMAAKKNNIIVSNVINYSTQAVVQHIFTLILSLSSHLLKYDRLIQQKTWRNSKDFCLPNYPITELAGKKLGIIGYGHIGRGIERVAKAFAMQVLIADLNKPIRPGRITLSELLSQVDILTLSCPLTTNTHHLINHDNIKLLASHCLIINTARGPLLDSVAVAEALAADKIGGVGLDVLEEEPPPIDDPLLTLNHPNVIITPHIAWASQEARIRLVKEVANNIKAFLKGEPINVVS